MAWLTESDVHLSAFDKFDGTPLFSDDAKRIVVVQSEDKAVMIGDGNGALWRRLKGRLISLWRRPTADSTRSSAFSELAASLEPLVGAGDARDLAYAPDEAAKQRAGFSQHISS
jgi:hypothetical protein